MYQTYSLTRAFDADDMRAQTFTVSDDDAINCAHMLAAGFNTMSRNFTLGFVMAVVDTQNGTVQFDGKVEELKKSDPWSTSQTFTFNPTAGDADTILSLLDEGGKPTFTAAGKFSFAEPDEPKTTAEFAQRAKREVLEAAYVELDAVKNVLFEAGCETIPADAGVRDLADMHLEKSKTIERRDVEIAELVQERINANERAAQHEQANRSAVVEMVNYVKAAHAKLDRIDPAGDRDDLQGRMRGMLDVLAKFLVVTGEADYDERHAVARRLCEIGD